MRTGFQSNAPRPTIHRRVLMVALIPATVVAVILVFYFTVLRYGDVETGLRQRGSAMARQLIPASEYGLFSGNVSELSRLSQAILREPDVSGIAFFDRDGALLARAGRLVSSLRPENQRLAWDGSADDENVLVYHVAVEWTPINVLDPFATDGSEPQPPRSLGSITLELSRVRVIRAKFEIFLFSLATVILVLLLGAFLARRLGQDISLPLAALEAAFTRLQEGQLETRVVPHKAATVAGLEAGFNEMARNLEQSRLRLDAALASSEAELSDQYEFATALLQALSDAAVGILIVQGRQIFYANEAAAQIHGLSRAQLMTLEDWATLMKPRADLQATLLGAMSGGGLGGQPARQLGVQVNLENDEARYVDVVMVGMKSELPFPRVVLVEADVTEQRFAQQRLNEANQALALQRDEAERASQAKSRFLAAASHDMRQPIAALGLFASELVHQTRDLPHYSLAIQINTAIKLLAEMMNSLLDISRLDIHAVRPERTPVALGALLQNVILAHYPSAEAKGLGFTLVPTSLQVLSDGPMLSRIIGNLLSNAVRYTEHGRILVGVRRTGGRARIQVWDTGIGMDAEHLPHVFQEFYQVANPERDSAKGLGLGLSIVERLSRALEHTVTVRSWPGKGSVFEIALDLVLDPAVPAQTAQAAEGLHRQPAVLLLLSAGKPRDDLQEALHGWGYGAVIFDPQDLAKARPSKLPPVVLVEAETLLYQAGVADVLKQASHARLILLGPGRDEVEQAGWQAEAHFAYPIRLARLRALLQHLSEDGAP